MADATNDAPAIKPEAPLKPKGNTIASTPAHNLDAMVDAWFAEFIPNSPASASVESWNHLMAAKEELKRRLAKESA